MPPRLVRLGSYALAYVLAVLGLTLVALGAGPRPAPEPPGALAAAGQGSAPSFEVGRPSPRPASYAPPTAPVVVVPATLAPNGAASPPALPRPTVAASHGPATPAQAGPNLASRIEIPELGIDLPVVRQNAGYPYCNVAMYLDGLGQPGRDQATYVYAHARAGMFLPIYTLARAGKQNAMVGMTVNLYTGANRLYRYRITEVRLHQLSTADALNATTDQLWVQTSEGPAGTPGKTQLVAKPVSNGPASAADAVPVPHPAVCG